MGTERAMQHGVAAAAAAAAPSACASHPFAPPPSENLEGEYSGLEHEVVEGVVESLKVRARVCACVCVYERGSARREQRFCACVFRSVA